MGARVSGAIVERNGDAGLPPGSVRLRFAGAAGQSFGAFLCRGVQLELEGEANDYVGKGLSGGEITIRPYRRARPGRSPIRPGEGSSSTITTGGSPHPGTPAG